MTAKENNHLLLKVIMIIVLLAVVVFALTILYSGPLQTGKNINYSYVNTCDNPVYSDRVSSEINFATPENNKLKGFQLKYTCTGGPYEFLDSYYHSMFLKDNSVLIYNFCSHPASTFIFDSKSNKLVELTDKIHFDNSLSGDCTYKPVKISNDHYYLIPDVLYNIKSGEFAHLPDEQIQKYDRFIKERRQDLVDTKYVNTFAEKQMLFIASNKNKPGIEVWLEDPYRLQRSSYGMLKNYTDNSTAIMLKNGQVLFLIPPELILFNPQNGYVKDVSRLQSSEKSLNAKFTILEVSNNKLFIDDGTLTDPIIFDLEQKKVYAIKRVSCNEPCLLDNGDGVNYRALLLSDGKVFIYGYLLAMYDPQSNILSCVKNNLPKKLPDKLIELGDGRILSLGGYNPIDSHQYRVFKTVDLITLKQPD